MLLEIEARSVGQPKPRNQHTGKAEPWDDVELGLCIDIVVKHRSKKSSGFADHCREAMGTGSDFGGEDLSGYQERDRVGSKLVEKRGEEIHRLEATDSCRARVVFEVEGWDNKHDEAHQEPDLGVLVSIIRTNSSIARA